MTRTTEDRDPADGSARAKRRVGMLAAVLVAISLGTAGGVGSYAAFSATSANTGNQVSSGTVKMSDNDGGTAAFTVSNLQPNSTQTRCIRAKSEGSLNAQVRTYATVGGSGLAPYVAVRITRGTQSSPSFPSCLGFAADSTDYLDYGAGVVYAGTLADMPTGWANGIVDPPGTGGSETWTTNETHDYRIQLVVGDNRGAEAKDATATFTWEGRDAGGPYAQAIQGTSGLQAYWRLGETSGTGAVDSAGSNPGTYTGGFTLARPGAPGGDADTAAQFDGSSGYVAIPDAAKLRVGSAFTYEAWVKSSSATFRPLVAKGKLSMALTASGALELGDSGEGAYATSNTTIADSEWHHVAATFNNANNTGKVYIDGVDRTGSTYTGFPNSSSSASMYIGRDDLPFGGTEYANATIDEVAIYNRVLSPSEIAAHRAAG